MESTLAQLADHGGFCLGLLDPATNIVLNTLSLLPHGFEFEPNPSPMPSGRRNASNHAWHGVACRSSACLLEFMRAYFGLLSEEQAGRFLVSARADLVMAVQLVEHELNVAQPAPPNPRSGRTRQSLRLAAMHMQDAAPFTGQPSVADDGVAPTGEARDTCPHPTMRRRSE
ncbi:hypothetical protein D1007_52169 [Hordeum vulgare]|nr:hypothetical protein D1007_52169 [Hordeum vulgare]